MRLLFLIGVVIILIICDPLQLIAEIKQFKNYDNN